MKINKCALLMILGVTISNAIYCDNPQRNTQSPTALNMQIKNFMGRVDAYLKCLKGNCSLQEREVVAKAALKDGVILAAIIGTLVGGGILINQFSNWTNNIGYGELSTTFLAKDAVESALKHDLYNPYEFELNINVKNPTKFFIQKSHETVTVVIIPAENKLSKYERFLIKSVAQDLIDHKDKTNEIIRTVFVRQRDAQGKLLYSIKSTERPSRIITEKAYN